MTRYDGGSVVHSAALCIVHQSVGVLRCRVPPPLGEPQKLQNLPADAPLTHPFSDESGRQGLVKILVLLM